MTLRHVKAHGALYNVAVRDRSLADAIARAIAAVDRSLVMFGLPNSAMLDAGQAAGLRVAAEGFADRSYEADGSLTPRRRPGAVIHDPDAVVARAVRMARESARCSRSAGPPLALHIDTICVHGDTPGADGSRDDARGSPRRGHRRPPPSPLTMTECSLRRWARVAARLVAQADAGANERWWPAALRLDARRLRRHALRARASRRQRRSWVDEGSRADCSARRCSSRQPRRHRLRLDCRSLRPDASDDAQRRACIRSSPPRAGLPRRSRQLPDLVARCSDSAWAANGRAARLSCRSGGRPSIAARPSASCRAVGPSATRLRR